MIKNWSIWDIKNRWLRAAVAWVGVPLTAAVVIIAFAVAAVVGAIRGLWQGPVDLIGDFDEWGDLIRYAWAAMTAREES